jgi:2-polyprenyl-3-methyl-5-hydroxy-6-metoxy-1,4-benzoquinol methylase
MPCSLFRLPRDYAEQTHASPYLIVRYPHRERYRRAVEAATELNPESLLDYGGGDGYFVVELCRKAAQPPKRVVLYEPAASMADLAERGIADVPGHINVMVVRDPRELAAESFDAITCLGVLEHLPLVERYAFYDTVGRTLRANGRCVIDVPVEVGPGLLIKHLARRLLKGRTPEVTAGELIGRMGGAAVFDPARFDPTVHDWIHFHAGFDYRILAKELASRFQVVRSFGTPFMFLPPILFNQEAFFVVTTARV